MHVRAAWDDPRRATTRSRAAERLGWRPARATARVRGRRASRARLRARGRSLVDGMVRARLVRRAIPSPSSSPGSVFWTHSLVPLPRAPRHVHDRDERSTRCPRDPSARADCVHQSRFARTRAYDVRYSLIEGGIARRSCRSIGGRNAPRAAWSAPIAASTTSSPAQTSSGSRGSRERARSMSAVRTSRFRYNSWPGSSFYGCARRATVSGSIPSEEGLRIPPGSVAIFRGSSRTLAAT